MLKKRRIDANRYFDILLKTDLTVEKKKSLLLKHLNELLIKTFSVDTKKENQKKILNHLKTSLPILREIVMKLRDLNYYLETIFLEESGLVKNIKIELLDKKELKKLKKKEERHLSKKDLSGLEHLVYEMIKKIIFFDKRLLTDYKKKERGIEEEENIGINQIEKILKKESAVLMHLEAKLPPAEKIRVGLIKPISYTHWVARIFALISALGLEYQKELNIFGTLKEKETIRKKLNVKIKNIIKEKETILKLKEEKVESIKKIEKLGEDWIKATHYYTTVAKL